ncbi:MAG: GAF domain-containing SpoIIE family protein phosphatase, partial [Thermoguttaceae bacterium]
VATGSSSLRLEVNPQAKLKALIEISQNLGKALGLGEVLPKILDSLFAMFVQADRGFIVLRERASGRLVPKAVKHRNREGAETIRISRTIVRSVMTSREAILSADAASDARFDMSDSIVDFHIRSLMCVPLIDSAGESLGVIQIDTVDPRRGFNREDLDMLASVACQAAFAVENAQLHEAALREQALERELSVAHDVLQGFLPAASPEIGNYDFFQFYEPAHQLGGDYYDYIPLSGGRLGIAVADVSGKGIPAALLMARLSADTRYCLASEPTPAAAMCRLNRTLYGRGWDDRFVTFLLLVLDPLRHEVTMVNAGHPPPLLRRGGQVCDAVSDDQTRLPLGVDREVDYVQCMLPLERGDYLALYTDGITEAMNDRGELYGFKRLAVQLAREAKEVSAVGRGILADVKQFVGTRPQSDDMCLVCVGCLGEG